MKYLQKPLTVSLFFFFLLLFFGSLFATDGIRLNATLSKGITLGNWLTADEVTYIQTTRYAKTDFENIQALGCDHVRITANFRPAASIAPDYTIHSAFLGVFDKAAGWVDALGLKLVIAYQSTTITDGNMETEKERLIKVWQQLATRYASKGDFILYEIFDEPEDGISAANWNQVLNEVITAIRAIDNTHTIIVAPVNWSSVDELSNLDTFTDTNLLYSFHYFSPILFTHQGASWDDVDYATTGIPFPYDAGRMPALDTSHVGTSVETEYNDYANTGTVDYIHTQLDKAGQFATERSVPVWCGDFGVYREDVAMEDRANWLQEVRTYLETKGIAWCFAGFRGGWGIYDSNSNEMFKFNVNDNIVNALGLTPPEEEFMVPEKLTESLIVFEDAPSERTRVNWWVGEFGEPDFLNTDSYEGQYCVGFYYPGQYSAINFAFRPLLDLEDVVYEDYVLHLWFRCDDPTAQIDLRFVDTNEDYEEHPWRMQTTLSDGNPVDFDGEWQEVDIPLIDFTVTGAWDPDDQTWYNSLTQDEYEWYNTESLRLVSEAAEHLETEFYFDNIIILDPTVDEVPDPPNLPQEFMLSQNYPNPFNPDTRIWVYLPEKADVTLMVYDIRGALITTLLSGNLPKGTYQVNWNGNNQYGKKVASGVYTYTLQAEDHTISKKMVLIR